MMNTNKEKTTFIYIKREHDKICLLEKIIIYITNTISITTNANVFETIISNLIDSIILRQENNTQLYLDLLKETINEEQIINLITDLSISIANEQPYILTIEVNEQTNKYINYINNNYILPFF
jgi:hypothetical protein